MARKIKFDVEVNSGGFDAGMKMIEARASAANGRMNRTVYESSKRVTALTAQQVNSRIEYQERQERKAIGRANYESQGSPSSSIPAAIPFRTGSGIHQFTKADRMGSFGSATSMALSVARDSAASLASGAPVSQIIGQQLPQLLQMNAMLAMQQGAVGKIAQGFLKWGLGIGAGVAALVGFHYATKAYFTMAFQGFNDLEKRNESLRLKGEKLRELRKEQQAEDDDKAKKAAEAAKLNEEILTTNLEHANLRANIREAGESDPDKRKQMIVDRLKSDEQLAAQKSALSGRYLFGTPEQRKAALLDQVELDKATLARVEAEQAGSTQKKSTFIQPNSDSLTSVGNFLGSGRGMIQNVAEQQLNEQKNTTAAVKLVVSSVNKLADKMGPNGGIDLQVPSS